MNIEIWPISRVVPYVRNPRKNDEAVATVAASLAEFGWQQPLVVDTNGVLVVGHTRLKAARQLGMVEVPVHVAANLTPAQAKAYRIMDNRSGERAQWDTELLALELEDLRLDDFDLDLTGFDAAALDEIMDEAAGNGDHGDGVGARRSGSLSDRFMAPPFSVLSARDGWWQDRKRAWIAIGIQSELGRGEQLIPNGGASQARPATRGGAQPRAGR